jgi:hypothetical protein
LKETNNAFEKGKKSKFKTNILTIVVSMQAVSRSKEKRW